MKKRLMTATILMATGLSTNLHADETRTEGLNLELTPYFWGAGIDGKVEIGPESVHFNRSFSDIWDNTEAAFMGLAVISYDRFVLYADYDYLSLSNDDHTRRGLIVPAGTKAKVDTDLDVGTYGGGYRFDTFGKNTIDVLIGAQLTNLDNKIKAGPIKLSNKDSLDDTVVMLRPSFQFAERWRFNPTLAYGISGDSDTTYSLMPQLQWQFSDSFALRFGYKRLYYKFKENGNQLDASFSGPFVGLGWTWPERKKEVAAAPPAPAPVTKPAPVVAAKPAKCPDADNDGVCDADDACPNTPPGTRVGPAGCDCDYVLRTHFAFNSAELNAEDKAALDQLAKTLLDPRLHFVTGEVHGYTDNTGPAEYNLQLSKRRADAVAAYLKSKGVAFGDRFTTQGFGEERPIADNSTAEGRAQNRRVSIHRTDCGPPPK